MQSPPRIQGKSTGQKRGTTRMAPPWRVLLWVCVLTWSGLCLLLPPMVQAENQAEVEYAKGIVAYGQRDYLTALDHFRTVVTMAPDNPDARFYLGLSLSRVGEFTEAIEALEQALRLDTAMQHVHHPLGLAYFQEARYAEALTQFQRAEQHDPNKAATQFYLGYTQYQLKRYRQTLAPLQRALEIDPTLAPSVHYYRGLALYALRRDGRAQDAFEAVVEADPTTVIGQNAQRYLEAIKTRASEQRLVQLQGAVSFQYDDNVILAPNDDIFNIAREGDARTVFSFVGRLLPVRTASWRLGAEYALFQSLHFDLTDFDLQTHTGRLFTSLKLSRVTLRLAADYTFTRLANDRFSEAITVQPSVFFQPTDRLFTVASLRYRNSNFFDQFIFPGQEDVRDRDGWNIRPSLDQYLTFNKKRSYVRLSYHYEGSRNEGSDWEYDSHQVGLGLHTPLVWGIDLDIDGTYQLRDYLNINSFDSGTPAVLDPGDTRERRDDRFTASLLLTRKLGRYLILSAGYVHTSNVSNIDFFEYRRNIWTLALTGRY